MSTPTIYLLHGDDEFGMAEFVQDMQEKMGDPTTAGMNTTRLEGRVPHQTDFANHAGVHQRAAG